MGKLTYRDAGVDLDLYQRAMARLPRLLHRTYSPRVLQLDGGFAGLFQLDFENRLFARQYVHPVLVSGSDGVGTKLKVAQVTGIHDSVGIDLVAMCVNDVLCCGAEPLFFLDYLALSRDDPTLIERIVQGISDGCVEADCALLGGETAIMPDVYQSGEYDLAGFCVGVVEKKQLIDGRSITPGDVLLGLASSGLHSNGFSLVRKAVFESAGLSPEDPGPQAGRSVQETLLQPTRIYTRTLRTVLAHYKVKRVVHGIAHITGGGLPENIQRILPPGTQAVIDRQSWSQPAVFGWLQELGRIDRDEMQRVFNLGIGLVLIVRPHFADSIQRLVADTGIDCYRIGDVIAGNQTVVLEG